MSPVSISDWDSLQTVVSTYEKSGIYIVSGKNSGNECLPIIQDKLQLPVFGSIELETGEKNKTLENAIRLWNSLVEKGATRNSLLICLGGGIVCDMAAFAASCFKRGMPFVLIPTTLLAMVDACLGGKTGVNLRNIKNQIGTFAKPESIFIFPELLDTLPKQHILSGFAEILKHALLQNQEAFQSIQNHDFFDSEKRIDIINSSIEFKLGIVEKDPFEKGSRKILNFGHTIGHVLESLSIEKDEDSLTHGEAVAMGMLIECEISKFFLGFPEDEYQQIKKLILKYFDLYQITHQEIDHLIDLMHHDKKRSSTQGINFTLLKKIGVPVLDQFPDTHIIRKALGQLLDN